DVMWVVDGTWERVFTALLAQADAEGDLDWVVAVDSTIVRAHQHAAGARQKGPRQASRSTMPSKRSRGKLTTKVHLAADGRRRPLTFALTSRQAGNAPALEQIMAQIRAPRLVGRPRSTPAAVLADKAYSSHAIRRHQRRRGIRTVIWQPADQAAHRKRPRRPGRPPQAARPTRPPTASGPADPAAALPSSTATPTNNATPSNAAPTNSSSGAARPPTPTRPPPSTSPDSTPQPSSPGPQDDPKETHRDRLSPCAGSRLFEAARAGAQSKLKPA
ncbi:transposase, partial [Streptomyces sp. NPDC060085]|uniref:transposase n=1 Tax=Streptomyces sp. NPDC060085 TaxID=3347054 RepID=UPI003652FA8A